MLIPSQTKWVYYIQTKWRWAFDWVAYELWRPLKALNTHTKGITVIVKVLSYRISLSFMPADISRRWNSICEHILVMIFQTCTWINIYVNHVTYKQCHLIILSFSTFWNVCIFLPGTTVSGQMTSPKFTEYALHQTDIHFKSLTRTSLGRWSRIFSCRLASNLPRTGAFGSSYS